jgi:hypothetical protein
MVLLLARYWTDMPICLVGYVAYAVDRMRILAFLTVASSVSNLAITIYFVHSLRMGAVGSALGTLIAAVFWSMCVMWPFSLKLLGLEFGPWFKAVVWRGVLPSVVAGLFALAWRYWIEPSSIVAFLLATVLVASVYLLSILLLCLDDQERRELKQLFVKFSSQGLLKLLAPSQ